MLVKTPTTNSASQIDISPARGSSIGKMLEKDGLGAFEPNTLAAALAFFDTFPASRFMDIGANIGLYSWTIKKAFSHVDVHAFEPFPELADQIEAICDLNGLDVTIHRSAVSNENGTAELHISRKSDSSNSLNKSFRPYSRTVEVPVLTLDEACRDFHPDLIKIDTETTEPDVLEGGISAISQHRPWIICEVLAGRTEDRLNDLVGRLNYSAHWLDGALRRGAEPIFGDRTYNMKEWLFVPDEISPEYVAAYENRIKQLQAL